MYRKSSAEYNFENKTVILVDDGAATGATTILAARWIRNQTKKPKRLIVALPIANKEAAMHLQQECDRLQVITKPSSGFCAVAQYYQNFDQVTDEQIEKIMYYRHTRN